MLALLELPWFGLSLALVVLVAVLVGFWPWGLLVIGVWVASGPLILIRRVEEAIMSGLDSLRRPTRAEYERLAAAWVLVTRAAQIDPRTYSVWVQKSAKINAYATAGHTVAVTEGAVARLSPEQLEAVLAHELGHHLGRHASATLLVFWYSLPALYVFQFAAALNMAFTSALRSGSRAISVATAAFVIIFLVYLAVSIPIVGVSAIVLFLLQYGLLWVRRAQEFEADAIAAQIGYGDALATLLNAWAAPSNHPPSSLLLRLSDTHPPYLERAQRLVDPSD